MLTPTARLTQDIVAIARATYISENRDKSSRFALVSVSGSGEGNERAIPDFEAALGKKVSATLLLKEDELKQGDYEKKL